MSISGISPSPAHTPAARLNGGCAPGCTCALHSSSLPVIPARSPGGDGNSRSAVKSLSEEDKRLVRALQRRDREVRAHEQAHLAAASGVSASGPSYDYQLGPDGVRYAIGGHVRIDVSPGNSPEETVRKARVIQSASLAPAQPSGQDQMVAALARQMELKALAEQAAQRREQGPLQQAYTRADDAPPLQGQGVDASA